METLIINADKSHINDIAELEKLCFYPPWSPAQIESEIDKESAIFLVCICEGEFAGYVSGENIAGELYIGNIAVKQEHQGKGIGYALMKEIISIAKNQNCSFLTLEVRKSNTAAKKLYEKCSMVLAGERRNFYSHPAEDACIYTIYF